MNEREDVPAGRFLELILHPNRRPHGFRLLIALLVLVVSAIPVDRESLSSAELSTFRWINEFPSSLEPFLGAVMQFGSLIAVFVVAVVAIAWTKRKRIGIDLALSGALAWLFAVGLKALFARGRPADLLADVIIRGTPGTGHGYVSGHAAVAAALATVAVAYLDLRGKVVAAVLALLVAVARVYVGAHLPLDIVGGAAMGWAVGSLVHFLVLPEVMDDRAGAADR